MAAKKKAKRKTRAAQKGRSAGKTGKTRKAGKISRKRRAAKTTRKKASVRKPARKRAAQAKGGQKEEHFSDLRRVALARALKRVH